MRRAGCLVLVACLLAGCSGDDDYCTPVEERQAELTDVTASGSPAALLEGLPIFRDLADRAPEDIDDEWRTFLIPLEELDNALQEAQVDPASYDPERLPSGLSDDDRARIEAAGTALADPAVARAFDGVQQQAKDVCHVSMSL